MRIRTDLFEDSYEVYEDLGRFVEVTIKVDRAHTNSNNNVCMY